MIPKKQNKLEAKEKNKLNENLTPENIQKIFDSLVKNLTDLKLKQLKEKGVI